LYFIFTVQHISIYDFILIQLTSTFGGVDHVLTDAQNCTSPAATRHSSDE